jgi:hypothetical protein
VAAAADALRRLEQEAQARKLKAERERLATAEVPLLALCEGIELVARSALVATGYHRHDRGAWRRYHGRQDDEQNG